MIRQVFKKRNRELTAIILSRSLESRNLKPHKMVLFKPKSFIDAVLISFDIDDAEV